MGFEFTDVYKRDTYFKTSTVWTYMTSINRWHDVKPYNIGTIFDFRPGLYKSDLVWNRLHKLLENSISSHWDGGIT